MSLPFSSIVPITGVVESPAFAQEKKHMLLAMDSSLIPSGTSYLEFGGASALTDFSAYFGKQVPEYQALVKYFGFVSKNGNAPEKALVARWYKTATAPFIKGDKLTTTVATLKAITDGSLTISFDDTAEEITGLDFSSATSYSDIATVLQTGIATEFTGATVVYNSITGGFIVTGGTTGKTATTEGVNEGTTGTDVSVLLGLKGATTSQGVDAETFADFCDRIYHANTGAFSITTLETLADTDITPAVAWLQTTLNGQSYNTVNRLVFNFTDKTTAKTIASTLDGLNYTGFVICYDPYGENVNILDCAICASIDYQIDGGAINFNFQPAVGYTAITSLGTVVDYQQGLTNSSLMQDLDNNAISCVYSVGFGTQEQVFYGSGLMAGDFGTESTQVDESALELAIQVSILNGLASLNKIPLRGEDATDLVSSLLATPIEQFIKNGVIAQGATLSTVEKASVAQATGNANASDSLEMTGYYYKIYDLTEEDIAQKRVRVLLCYVASGCLNKVRIINKIYGA